MDIAPINTGFLPDEIKQIYKEIGLRATSSKLIFGDTVRRPWDLYFDRGYIMDRVLNVNEYTRDVIEKCVWYQRQIVYRIVSLMITVFQMCITGGSTHSSRRHGTCSEIDGNLQ